MTSHSDSGTMAPGAAGEFATTHWSVVIAAGGDSTLADAAREKLCRAYWYPLYAYVRRKGYSTHDAQDLTQSFFARFIEKSGVKCADQTRGRFRSFLLSSLKNFLMDEWDKARARKRGGGLTFLSLEEFAEAEPRYGREPRDNSSAERIFERRWAMTVLDQALARLEAEYKSLGKQKLFESLCPILLGEKSSLTCASLGAQMGMTEGAVKVAAHRLRRRHRESVRAVIADTVSSAGELDDEIRSLFAILGG